MAYHCSLCIIGAMDRLWFYQIALFSQSTALVAPKSAETPQPVSESLSCPALPFPPEEEETSTDEPPSPEKQISSGSISLPLLDDSKKKEENQEKPKKENLLGNRIRSRSSSPSTPNSRRKLRKLGTAGRLQKSMSNRTLGELELEEVKGFMDLGFIFKRENMSPRMMSVVPGLQRLSLHQNKQRAELIDAPKAVEDGDVVKMEDKRDTSIVRPYLSEAWLIKRPDSQLLNLKIPRLCSAADMKKHLRFWAKTVASEIHQE